MMHDGFIKFYGENFVLNGDFRQLDCYKKLQNDLNYYVFHSLISSNESILIELYCDDDFVLHRQDGPAETWYFSSGAMEEKYYIKGKYYRPNGPSHVYIKPMEIS